MGRQINAMKTHTNPSITVPIPIFVPEPSVPICAVSQLYHHPDYETPPSERNETRDRWWYMLYILLCFDFLGFFFRSILTIPIITDTPCTTSLQHPDAADEVEASPSIRPDATPLPSLYKCNWALSLRWTDRSLNLSSCPLSSSSESPFPFYSQPLFGSWILSSSALSASTGQTNIGMGHAANYPSQNIKDRNLGANAFCILVQAARTDYMVLISFPFFDRRDGIANRRFALS